MTTTVSAVECARIFRFVLDNPQNVVATRIEALVTALRNLDEAFCSARDDMSRAERAYARQALTNARTLVAVTTGSAS